MVSVDTMNICFVCPRFPFPILKGDTLRAYHQIKELSKQNHSIHLIAISEHVEPTEEAKNEMLQYCDSIEIISISKSHSLQMLIKHGLFSKYPLQVLYFLSPKLREAVQSAISRRHFDIIHVMTIRIIPAALNTLNVPVVVDFMDSYGANISTRKEYVNPLVKLGYNVECARVAKYERRVALQVDGGIVIAELDRETIGNPLFSVIPNGVDLDAFLGPNDGTRSVNTLIFTGNMGYQPNVDAVTWFVANCWQHLYKKFPNLKFLIVGARPAASILELAQIPGIEVTGQVESMMPYFNRATVSVCPIRCGSGMQNKVLEAMAAGVPVVTTEFVNRAINAETNSQISVVPDNDANAFIAAVADLLCDNAKASQQAKAARSFVENNFTWSFRATQLIALYDKVIAKNHAPVI
jgi:sugar transferase (PEP-CTERM/EpsH1 system associated)